MYALFRTTRRVGPAALAVASHALHGPSAGGAEARAELCANSLKQRTHSPIALSVYTFVGTP